MKTANKFQILTILPLLAIGIIIILCILIYNQYVRYGSMEPVVVLPGGVTYLGK